MFQAIHATSTTLRDFLQTSIDADPFFGAGTNPWTNRAMRVRLHTPEEMTRNNGQEGLSLWLYRLVRDEERLNDPARRISSNQLQPPPLPMRLHYLATPITSRQNDGDPDTEQYVLGKVLQLFHSRPVFRGADLHDQLVGTQAQLFVRLETLSLDEISRVWEGLNGSFQLSVSYEVSLVDIDAAVEPLQVSPVVVALPSYAIASPVMETT